MKITQCEMIVEYLNTYKEITPLARFGMLSVSQQDLPVKEARLQNQKRNGIG